MSQEKRLFRIVLPSTIGKVVLLLLATAVFLHGQSAQQVFLSQQSSSLMDVADKSDRRVADEAASLHTDVPLKATDAKSSRTVLSILPVNLCTRKEDCAGLFSTSQGSRESVEATVATDDEDRPSDSSKQPPVVLVRNPKPVDRSHQFYYKNKVEFSLDGGWHPINIPFAFDVFAGDGYTMTPLKYTLVPIIASVRWQMDDVDGPWIFRGNWDLTASGAVVVIPRGPETRYFAWIMGIRRNFVPRNPRVAPYFDLRLGLGNIDAKGPKGAVWAQGEDFTFTFNLGSGARYNFNPRYSISAGINYMHISNFYLSEPRYANYGINVYGPMFGLDIRLGKPHLDTAP